MPENLDELIWLVARLTFLVLLLFIIYFTVYSAYAITIGLTSPF